MHQNLAIHWQMNCPYSLLEYSLSSFYLFPFFFFPVQPISILPKRIMTFNFVHNGFLLIISCQIIANKQLTYTYGIWVGDCQIIIINFRIIANLLNESWALVNLSIKHPKLGTHNIDTYPYSGCWNSRSSFLFRWDLSALQIK